jgi:quercetin dioxygenase-like cupin family protein
LQLSFAIQLKVSWEHLKMQHAETINNIKKFILSPLFALTITLPFISLLCIVTWSLVGTAAYAQTVRTLLTKTLPEAPGKEIQVVTVYYAPGAVDPIHRHDAHAVVYVLEGEVEMQVRGGTLQRLGAGQVFYESPGDVHTVSRNASKTKPAKFVVFFVKNEGAPLLTPAR